MSAGPVERFSRIRGLLLVARENERILKASDDIEERTVAAMRCNEAEIALLDELNALDASGALDEIAEFLEVTYGGVPS